MKPFRYDIFRYYGKYRRSLMEFLATPEALKYIILFRKLQNSKTMLGKIYYRIRLRKYEKWGTFQISNKTKIGEGLYIGHSGRLVINGGSKIGRNCNIGTGVIIGQENRGKRKGCPTIGDCVWIGSNSTIVGKIAIGNNVLIAPNSYINYDIPSNSISFGKQKTVQNPGATESYIENKV